MLRSIIPCRFSEITIIAVMVALSTSKVDAQLQSGNIYFGGHTGLIGTGGAIPLGFDSEIGIGKVGPGVIGIGL